jgi:exosome complex RNA-binding protein Csl4
VITGVGSEQLLVRADGPALSSFGVTGVLAQPSLTVLDNTGKTIAANAGWGTGTNSAQVSSAATHVGAFALQPGSGDSAQVISLSAGAYTMQIAGVNNTTGVALAEVYEDP